MKFNLPITALALSLVTGAKAQSSHGYGFVGAGGATANGYTSRMVSFGFGGEARIVPHIGAGVELSGLGLTSNYWDSIAGMFSPNGYVHFKGSRDAKFDPYVSGGYTLIFRSGHANLANFGGGANFWPKRHLGFKVDVRDHVTTRYYTIHYWEVRAGVTFR